MSPIFTPPRKITLFVLLLFCLPTFFLLSCKKNLTRSISMSQIKAVDAPNYYFNWETATAMPVSPSSTYDPPMPWQSQSGSYIDAAILSDYKSTDGWVLVYNTFNPTVYPFANTEPAGGLYFALYNRYRGLLRFYLYIPPGLFGNSSDIEHGLSLYTANNSTSSMLNFEGSDIVNASPASNTSAFTKTNNTGVAVGGGWYAMQYEIAYDPNFSTTTYPNLGFSWNSKTVNISQIIVNGTQTGTITGNITQQSGGFDWANSLINAGLSAVEIYGTAGASTFGTMSSNLTGAATGGLAGNFTGLLTGIFGGNSNNPQEVDLKMNTNLSLNGTLTGSQPLVPNSLVAPGQTTGNTVGAPPPLYTSPLGVFNLTGTPTIDETTTKSTISNQNGVYYQYADLYTIDATIFNQLFIPNPAVINSDPNSGATIQNLKEEVVILNPLLVNYPETLQVGGVQEVIGNYTAFTGTNVGTTYTVVRNQPPNNFVAIRVSFKVVPNNGAPSPTIVKTFLANLVHI
jgi:hypothetical protein